MKTTHGVSQPQVLGQAKPRRGTATLEFAFLIPVLLSVILAIWESGGWWRCSRSSAMPPAKAGRQASTSNLTNAQVITVVRNYLSQAGLSTQAANNATITVTDLTTSSLDATQANQLDHFQITVSVNYSDVRWTNLNLIANSSTTLNGSADWYSMNDSPLSVSSTIPLQ